MLRLSERRKDEIVVVVGRKAGTEEAGTGSLSQLFPISEDTSGGRGVQRTDVSIDISCSSPRGVHSGAKLLLLRGSTERKRNFLPPSMARGSGR
jgi:hypothetical protein